MAHGTVKIIAVDDRPENLLAMEAVLSSSAYTFVGLHSGEETLRYLLREQLDDIAVILLDVQMHGMDGFETAQWIKRREHAREIPIIFVTAISKSLDHVLQGYQAGSVDYIFKPYHPDLLRLKVEAFVELHRYHHKVKLQGKLLEQRALELETANRNLAKAEALARMVGETSLDAILTCDGDGAILESNPEMESMFGYRGEEAEGLHASQLIPDWDRLLQQQGLLECEAVCKGGGRFPAEVQLGQAHVGGAPFIVCSIRNVMDRKQLEQEREQHYVWLEAMVQERTCELVEANQELTESKSRFQQLFVSNPCLMFIRRLADGRLVDVNESLLLYTGFAREEVIDQSHDLLKIRSTGEDKCSYVQGETCRNVQIEYSTKAGPLKEGLLSVEVIELLGETCELGVIADITEKVKWEREMARLARLNLVGEMAAGIAHEIRNPMTTIRGFLQMCKGRATIQEEYVDIMLEELARANGIITEYLSLAKNRVTHLQMCSLNEVVLNLLPLLEADALLTGKSVTSELEPIPDLMLDEKEVRQLILNLAINGLESMAAQGTLTIRTYRESSCVTLQVKDQGLGIRPEWMEKLGTPFFTTKDEGTGLGLAVCYSIAARHRAAIHVDSGSGGTIFYVRFPV